MVKHNQTSSDALPASNHAPVYTLSDILGAPCTKEEALTLLKADSGSYQQYLEFRDTHQQKLLALLMGKHSLAVTYDSFFKKIMSPREKPERLESFLAALLNQKVKIKTVLPNDGTKLTESGSMVIMDLLVELADGSIINVEIQKIGYYFSGERSSCYESDLIMRQYNRIKSDRGKHFSFRDLKPVCMIVIMEHSPETFKKASPSYIHRQQITYDSGAEVASLFKTIYISLDTFHSVIHNISNQLDAWLTFLSSDAPEEIVQLVNIYPEFLSCYQDIVKFRTNPKELITMYSEALHILDRNTAQLMVEDMQETIQQQGATIQHQGATIQHQGATIQKLKDTSAQKDAQIAALEAELEKLKKQK